MALRVCHVPSIVSMCQLQEDAAAAAAADSTRCCCSLLDGTTPLADAVGACLPLYQYTPASGNRSASSSGTASGSRSLMASRTVSMSGSEVEADVCVPDCNLATRIDEDLWAPQATMLEFTMAVKEHSNSTAATFTCTESSMAVPCLGSNMKPAAPANDSKQAPFLHPGNLRLVHQNTGVSLFNDSMLSEDDVDGSSDLMSPEASSDDFSTLDLPSPDSPAMALHRSASHNPSSLHPPVRSTIDTTLTALWDDCAARGLFRYDVLSCASKVLPGRWGWVAQLNEGRASKKRPTELRVDQVLQPFDANKFHFGKAFLREALFQFEPLGSPAAAGLQAWAASATGSRMADSAAMTPDPSLVMINVSPIDYGHVLLTPRVLSQQPQALEPYGVATALAFIREVANPAFRLGFNSLGAYATINHLHFQGYYLDAQLPCERAATMPVPGFEHPSLLVSTLVDYPVNGWVVEHRQGVEREVAEVDMAQLVMQVAGHLQTSDQPFNVLFVDQGKRAFIWPQCYAERQAAGVVPEELLETGVNPAVFEVAGHLVLKRAQDYEQATDGWAYRLLAGVSLTDTRFSALTSACFYKAAVPAAVC